MNFFQEAPHEINGLISEFVDADQLWAILQNTPRNQINAYQKSALKNVAQAECAAFTKTISDEKSEAKTDDAAKLQEYICQCIKQDKMNDENLQTAIKYLSWIAPTLALNILTQLLQRKSDANRELMITWFFNYINDQEILNHFYHSTFIDIHFSTGWHPNDGGQTPYQTTEYCTKLPLLAWSSLYQPSLLPILIPHFSDLIFTALLYLENMSVIIQEKRDKLISAYIIDDSGWSMNFNMSTYQSNAQNEFYYFKLEKIDQARTLLLTQLNTHTARSYCYSSAERRAMEVNLTQQIRTIKTLEELNSFRQKYKDSYCLNARRHYYFDKFCSFFSRTSELPPTQIKQVCMRSIDAREIELKQPPMRRS